MTSLRKTILVVEDDRNIRETLEEALQLEGYDTVAADNGQTGLEKLRQFPRPCLVLLDMMMPVMNGRAMLNAVLADPALFKIPVVVVSATADAGSSKGAVGFLRKPVNLDVLTAMISKHCGRA